MAPAKKSIHPKCKGTVLIVAMIFVVIFSTLAVSMATISGTNAQLASNQHKVDCALGSATSGLEVQRHWLTPLTMPSSTPQADYFSTIVSNLQSDLDANSISNFTLENDGSIPPVPLDSSAGQTFSGQMRISDANSHVLEVYSTGGDGLVVRTIKVEFDIEPYEWPIFDYGLATKGPVHFLGNPNLNGLNSNDEADIFIDSQNNNLALLVTGNTTFAGDINIGNSSGIADFQGTVKIGGDTGQTAIDNHVKTGVETPEFPIPDTQRFLQYATGPVIDSSTDLSSPQMIITNATIVAGTNPNFHGSVIIEGILYIEQPNIVTFESNVTVKGIIVSDGEAYNPGTNSISFLGNFSSTPFPDGAEFDAIREEKGTSILTPGFSATFAGNFSSISGVMAVSGALFSGNVSATVKGTIVNYSDNPTIIEGNSSLRFDRSDNIKVPAGFDTLRVLTYNPSSYSEL